MQPGFGQPGFQQPGMAPQGYGFGAPTAPKKKKWPWVLLVLFLLFGGCSFAVFKAVKGAITGVTDKANNFTAALYTDPSKASALTCSDAGMGTEALQDVKNNLISAGWTGGKNYNIPSIKSVNGTQTAIVTGTIKTSDGDIPAQVLLANGPKWCVNGFATGSNVVSSSGS
jgi:hypothetical protein